VDDPAGTIGAITEEGERLLELIERRAGDRQVRFTPVT